MAAATSARSPRPIPQAMPHERVSLVDLLDRVLAGGVVVSGEVTLSIAEVDLVTISLRALLASTGALLPAATEGGVDASER